MQILWRSICLVAAIFFFNTSGTATETATNIFGGPVDARLDALAKIQPGVGTVMIEYGNRFVDMYFAARGGNWGLAQYELKKMREIQQVGAVTRPNLGPLLKSFERNNLEPLEDAIFAKNWPKFGNLYLDAIKRCNECHAATDHAFIRFKFPAQPIENYIDFKLKSDPSSRRRER